MSVEPPETEGLLARAGAGDGAAWGALLAAQFDEAIKQLHKSIDGNWGANAANWLVLAMAHQRLGQTDEARKWFDKAVQWIDSTGPEARNEFASPLHSLHRLDSLACLVLRREAEQLLAK